MIKSFRHKGLKEYFVSGSRRRIPSAFAEKLAFILDLLDAASIVKDVDFPGSYLHPLKGAMKGFWAVRVSGNWRVVFQFRDGDAFEVDLVDYH